MKEAAAALRCSGKQVLPKRIKLAFNFIKFKNELLCN